MKKLISEFFSKENIEYYSALPYSALRITRPYLVEREGIVGASAIIFLIPYFSKEGVNISSYAVSRDYHLYIKQMTERLSKLLSEKYPEYKFVGFGDHSPIDERNAALISGLGILGDNGLIINEKYGSYVFIAELITDAPPELVGTQEPVAISACEGCGKCRAACPTGRLSGDAICLSDLTQKKGELTDGEASIIRQEGTVGGCDACQRVCPHNLAPKKTPVEFFNSDVIPELSAELVDSMSEEAFLERAFAWRGRKTVRRNLEISKKSK